MCWFQSKLTELKNAQDIDFCHANILFQTYVKLYSLTDNNTFAQEFNAYIDQLQYSDARISKNKYYIIMRDFAQNYLCKSIWFHERALDYILSIYISLNKYERVSFSNHTYNMQCYGISDKYYGIYKELHNTRSHLTKFPDSSLVCKSIHINKIRLTYMTGVHLNDFDQQILIRTTHILHA